MNKRFTPPHPYPPKKHGKEKKQFNNSPKHCLLKWNLLLIELYLTIIIDCFQFYTRCNIHLYITFLNAKEYVMYERFASFEINLCKCIDILRINVEPAKIQRDKRLKQKQLNLRWSLLYSLWYKYAWFISRIDTLTLTLIPVHITLIWEKVSKIHSHQLIPHKRKQQFRRNAWTVWKSVPEQTAPLRGL